MGGSGRFEETKVSPEWIFFTSFASKWSGTVAWIHRLAIIIENIADCAGELHHRHSKKLARSRGASGSYVTQFTSVVSTDKESEKPQSFGWSNKCYRELMPTTKRRAKRTLKNNKFSTSVNVCAIVSESKNLRNLVYGVIKIHRLDAWGICRTFCTTDNPKESILSKTEVGKILENKFNEEIPWASTKILYQQVHDIENLKTGLDMMVKNHKFSSVVDKTKNDISIKVLTTLQKDLKSHKYKPKANRRIVIFKPDGGSRYLGIASTRDKVVQATIKNLLSPTLEKVFSEYSYGFRPKIGAHDVFFKIRNGWQSVIWTISIDIKKCFDKVHHDILLVKLEPYIDQAMVELIRKLIKVGYIDLHNLNDMSKYVVESVLQRSILSPLLSNLYLHELDQYVTDTLLPMWNKGTSRPKDRVEYHQEHKLTDTDKMLLEMYPELKQAIMRVKHKRWLFSNKISQVVDANSAFNRLYYIRYADDFLFGFVGKHKDAKFIRDSVIKFLLNKLKLECNKEKSKITHTTTSVKYLGILLNWLPNQFKKKDEIKGELYSAYRHQAYNKPQLRVPVQTFLLKKAVDNGYARYRTAQKRAVKGTAQLRLQNFTEEQIVTLYNSKIRGILQYYGCCNCKSDLWPVVDVYRKSCALTLAIKLKMKTAAKVFSRFGSALTIRNNVGNVIASLSAYPTTLKTNNKFFRSKSTINFNDSVCLGEQIESSYIQMSQKAKTCQYKGCEETSKLQEYYINRNVNLSRKELTFFMRSWISNRKKIVILCHKHYILMYRIRLFEKTIKKNSQKGKK